MILTSPSRETLRTAFLTSSLVCEGSILCIEDFDGSEKIHDTKVKTCNFGEEDKNE
jgi:hypothetical protein